MVLLDEPVTVPRLAVAKAWEWEWERVGSSHPVLGIVDVWVEHDAASGLDDLTRQALAEPGFYDLRRGRVVGEFRDLMLAIANADTECYSWSSDRHGRDQAVLAIPVGRTAVVATIEGGLLTLERTRTGRLARAVVERLPGFAAADIGEFSVLRSQYGRSSAGERYALDVSSDYTVADPAEQLRALMGAPRVASHQVYVAARVDGIRQSSMPLTVVDSGEHGRVLTYLRPGDDGGLDIACGPGTSDYIVGTLENTLDALRA
ncbi:ESX secretion-associated protein EspG [Amycolatopsis sp. H20-H5]|uniref:ESX secretion-associated protein EspG n=1 Tax=Amycolatopsis sp. H20-H5 TaxID=3046309 RepID=UPI002DBB78C7|nr:ESX secretion-associated protein EspG [Amycolatopsis sp. H20-H5]MEC3980853.1 ESX secretion-associated protein EspG [Amycolatopsis sp. H20-H5]